jgi:acyl dehydratase
VGGRGSRYRRVVPVTTFDTPAALLDAVGRDLGCSRWLLVTQGRIDRFADATDDHQWIHVEPARAAAGPFGRPIAHGYLTLSLAVPLVSELVLVEGASMVLNYGTDRVRFPAPVPVDSRIRASAWVAEASPVAGGVAAAFDVVVEIEGAGKPGCVARLLTRYLV